MIYVKHIEDIKLDDQYPYRDKSKKWRFLSALGYAFLFVVGFLIVTVRLGLKIVGRKNLKIHKDVLKDGAITVCNHVHMWDFMCIQKAVRPRFLYFPVWATNLTGSNRKLIRLAGGIPIPHSKSSVKIFNDTINEILDENKWMHFFPEGSMWWYYQPLRPFKKGACSFAVRKNKPIVPLAFSYRPVKGFFKLFKKDKPWVTLNVGEPLLPDNSIQNEHARIIELNERVYRACQLLAGIEPDQKANSQTDQANDQDHDSIC